MSTRCNIILKDARYNGKTILYHHYDGYPEGVGIQLRKVLNCPTGDRFDTKGWSTALANKLVKNSAGLNDDNYEITDCIHSDIEYLYEVTYDYSSTTLKCWEYWYEWDEENERLVPHKELCTIPDWDGGRTLYEQEETK